MNIYLVHEVSFDCEKKGKKVDAFDHMSAMSDLVNAFNEEVKRSPQLVKVPKNIMSPIKEYHEVKDHYVETLSESYAYFRISLPCIDDLCFTDRNFDVVQNILRRLQREYKNLKEKKCMPSGYVLNQRIKLEIRKDDQTSIQTISNNYLFDCH